MRMLKVGDDIWHFDINRRVYHKPEDKLALGGGPIFREHWHKVKIVGETSRSWVTDWFGLKVPKRGADGWAFTDSEVDDSVYVNDNAHKIGRNVCACKDAEKLKAIAKIVEGL